MGLPACGKLSTLTKEWAFQNITQKRFMPNLVQGSQEWTYITLCQSYDIMPTIKLSTRAINSYRRSLKSWMGFVADGTASNFDTSVATALGLLLEDQGHMDEFLQRYPIRERDKRQKAVRQVVLLWLAELAI